MSFMCNQIFQIDVAWAVAPLDMRMTKDAQTCTHTLVHIVSSHADEPLFS